MIWGDNLLICLPGRNLSQTDHSYQQFTSGDMIWQQAEMAARKKLISSHILFISRRNHRYANFDFSDIIQPESTQIASFDVFLGYLQCSCYYRPEIRTSTIGLMLSAAASPLPPMSSRSAYTALTSEYALFPIAHTPVPSGLDPSSSRLRFELEHRVKVSSTGLTSAKVILSRIYSWLASAKDVMQRNTGFLLSVASQACFTFMNLAVKILSSIDPPITALEVCLLSITLLNGLIWWYSAYSRSNGTHEIFLSTLCLITEWI